MAKEKHGWGHDQLAADLAAKLREGGRMVWVDMQLGPVGSPRPDVFTMAKSYTNPAPIAYEVKISRSDFLKDIGAAKWHSYLQYATGVMFCAPADVLVKNDIPDGAGLMLRGADGWRTVRAPRLQPLQNMPRDAWMKLLIDGLPRLMEREARNSNTYASTYRGNDAIVRRYGKVAGKVIADIDWGRRELQQTKDYKAKLEADIAALRTEARTIQDEAKAKGEAAAQAQMADLAQVRKEICAVLGLAPDSNIRVIQREVMNLRHSLTVDAARQRLGRALQDIQHMATSMLQTENKIAPVGE